MNTNKKVSTALGEYVKEVFDLNKDGRVTFKEFLTTLVPMQAVGLALIVVDILALLGEYRVWSVGMHITNNDPYASAGFVAVSLVPFYLSQVLWLYPHATGWQQFIAVVMLLTSLVTSANFGLADLSHIYNVQAISKTVVWLWLAYIVMLLLYVLADRKFKLLRMKVQARANASFRGDMNETANSLLESLEKSLAREQELRAKYGDDAVEAHLLLLQGAHGKNRSNHKLPEPANPTPPPPQNQ